MNKAEFVAMMETLKAAYGKKFHDLTKEVASTWYNCLSDLDGDRLKTAAERYIKDHQYPPTISELREAYRNVPAPEPDDFDRFKNIPPETVKQLMSMGIITEDAGIDLYNATSEHVELLQKAGAL